MKNFFFNSEFIFVKFPILFPLLYFYILFNYPAFEIFLIFFTILILAETHFGATWPFFINSVNTKFIKENSIKLILFPIVIILLSLFGFFLFKDLFLLIFFAINVYHVTRQSLGICKIYITNSSEIKFLENSFYIFNFSFFLIGLLRFYFVIINEDQLIFLNLFFLLFFLIFLFIYLFKFKFSSNFFIFITGLIIFFPVCFVNNPVHAIIMGVTMHYSQYLFLTFKVYNGRKKDLLVKTSIIKYFIIIVAYSLIMSLLSLYGKSANVILNYLIIIPITGQMLHFYIDSQLWKFSDPHNRKVVLNYIKK